MKSKWWITLLVVGSGLIWFGVVYFIKLLSDTPEVTAYRCFAKGDYAQAVTHCSEIIRDNPDDDPQGYLMRGLSYYFLGEKEGYALAIGDFTKVLSMEKPVNIPVLGGASHSMARRYRGRSLQKMGRYIESLGDFEKLIQEDPENPEAFFDRGFSHDCLERYPDALADYSQAIKLKSDYAVPYKCRGRVYRIQKQLGRSLDDYSKAVRLAPNDAPAVLGRGLIYADMERWNEALADLERAIELDPGSVVAYQGRAYIHRRLGKDDLLEEDRKKIREIQGAKKSPRT